MTASCRIGAPTLEAVALRVRLALSASLGSWCSLGQTHERPHDDGAKTWARFYIYLKGLLVGSHWWPSPVAS